MSAAMTTPDARTREPPNAATAGQPDVGRHPAGGHLDGGGQPGRGRVTSQAELEQVAFELFAAKGFEQTTVEDIAAAAGIGEAPVLTRPALRLPGPQRRS